MTVNIKLWLNLLASLCELLGVFLLAVEAMKLDNFRHLRDKFIRPIYKVINPEIQVVEEETPETRAAGRALRLFLVSFAIVGAVFLLLISDWLLPSPTSLSQFIGNVIPGPVWVDIPVGLLVFIIASLITGLIIYTVIVGIANGCILILNAIDRHTPTGAIGILGFCFFLAGFFIKNYIQFVIESE